MEIIPVKYAESVLSENEIFQNGDRSKVRSIVFQVYLIKTAKRTILVDAGCETMPGFDMKNFIGSVKALSKMGINPDEITDVIITHAHHDHIECVKYFNRATIHIEGVEIEAGKRYIPEGFTTNVFNDAYAVCENVRVIKIGGHSAGSCIVEVKKDNKIYIIAGDECYSRECLERKVPTGSSFSIQNSKEFVERYSSNEYCVLLSHDE